MRDPRRRCVIDRLILWNIDLTLLDVGQVSRECYAEAFREVTGRSLAALPQLAGRSDSEIFFESLFLNDAPPGPDEAASTDLLAAYCTRLAAAFAKREADLSRRGKLLPGARAAVAAAADLPGVVQTVLTGTIRPNAACKLRAFGLDCYFDLEIGGYGSDAYPPGALLLEVKARAAAKYQPAMGAAAAAAVYVADTVRDVEAARVGGVRCLAVGTGRERVPQLRAAGADLVLPDLSDTERVTAALDDLTRLAALR